MTYCTDTGPVPVICQSIHSQCGSLLSARECTGERKRQPRPGEYKHDVFQGGALAKQANQNRCETPITAPPLQAQGYMEEVGTIFQGQRLPGTDGPQTGI